MSEIINEELEYTIISNNLADIKKEAEEHNKTARYYAKQSIPTRASQDFGIIHEKETGMPIATVSREKNYGGYRHAFQWHPDFLKIHPKIQSTPGKFDVFNLNKDTHKLKSKDDVRIHVLHALINAHKNEYRNPISALKSEDGQYKIFHDDLNHDLGTLKPIVRGYSNSYEYEPSSEVKSQLSDLQLKSIGHPAREDEIHGFAMKVHKELSSEKPYAVGSHTSPGSYSTHHAYVSHLSPEDLSKEHEKTMENEGHEITRTSPVTFEARKQGSKDTILSHAIGSKLHVHTFRENHEDYATSRLSAVLKNSESK